MTDRFYKKFKEYDSEKPKKATEISGLLGVPIGGAEQVEVPNRSGFVYVRLRNNTSELIQAFNEKVSPVYGLPVLVVYKGNRYEVIGRDNARYSDWGSFSSFLPRHGSQHSLNFEDGQGGDVTWIYSRQFMPLATIPSGTSGAGTVFIQPHTYLNPSNGTWSLIGDESSPNFLPAKPTDTNARMMLLLWDLDLSDPVIVTGSTFLATLTGTVDVLPYIPVHTNTRRVPLAAIRLVSGTESIVWDNIYDMRQFATTTPQAFGGGFAGQDEGAFLGTGTTLNFVGAGVTASLSGSVIQVNVPGGSAGVDTIGIAAMDDGTPIGTGSIVNFGSNLTAVRTGTTIFVDAAAGGGGGGTPIAFFDNSVFVKTGTAVSFDDGLTAVATGTTVYVNSQIPHALYFSSGVTLTTGTLLSFSEEISASFISKLGLTELIFNEDGVYEINAVTFAQYNSTDDGTFESNLGVMATGTGAFQVLFGTDVQAFGTVAAINNRGRRSNIMHFGSITGSTQFQWFIQRVSTASNITTTPQFLSVKKIS